MRRTDVKSADRHRLQFDFSASAYDDLVRMKAEYGAQSFAELVRDSLRLYDWLKKQQQEGYEIGLIKDGKLVKEVNILF